VEAGVDASGLGIADNPATLRWEATLGGRVVAYSEYRLGPGRVIFTHTVVQPEFEGRGIATRLVKTALDNVRDRGLRVTPRCPFVRAYVRRHSEYLPIVDFPPEGKTGA
jgi:predicted GNAT family acetyltransferase